MTKIIPTSQLHLTSSTTSCENCNQVTAVHTLTCDTMDCYYLDEFDKEDTQEECGDIALYSIEKMPIPVANFIKKEAPNYRSIGSIYSNCCEHCDFEISETKLHEYPGEAFFPMSDNDVSKISSKTIPNVEDSTFYCGHGIGGPPYSLR